MKKELVILAGSCYPISSATGSIAIKIGKVLSEKYNVRIIAGEQDGYHYDGTKIDGFKVYSITNWRLKWAQKSKNHRDNSHGLVLKLFHASFYMARLFGRFQATFLYLNNNKWYINKAYRKLLEINAQQKIDVILTCAAPHESHMAGAKFKRAFSDVRWVTYWGDLLASEINKLNIFTSMEKMKTIETDLCNACDYILTTEENYQILLDEAQNKERIKALPYTLNQDAIDRYNDPVIGKSEKTTLVYMGAFYRDIRNPDYFLRLMAKLECDFQLLLYFSGNCEDIVDSYVGQANGKIIKKKQVPKSELVEELRKADFLVNIENSIANTNPSKLLELISYGKPIIDFSFNDSITDTLQRYPLSLNVNMNGDIHINKKLVEDFINDNNRDKLELDIILDRYSMHLDSNVNKLLFEVFGGQL